MARKASAKKTSKPNTTDGATDLSKSQGNLTAQKIEKLYNDGREDIAGEIQQYWVNKAFWLGEQWVSADESTGQINFTEKTAKKRREQATNNRIKPAVRGSVARLQKTQLTFEVQSESADDYTQEGAHKAEAILRQKHIDDDWETLKEELVTATILGGTAGLITKWNPNADELAPDVPTGDGELEVGTIEDIVLETGSLDDTHARWWIHKQVLPPEQVQAMFKLEDTPPADGSDGGPFATTVTKVSSKLRSKNGAQVLWYYERPNHLRKKGAVVAVVNHAVAFRAAWPYPFKDRLNVRITRAILVPRQWTGVTYISDAISVQRQYNHLWTKIHEARNRTLGSKLLVDARHAELNDQLNDDPSIPIKLAPGTDAREPHYLEPPKLPPNTFQEITSLREELDDMLGVHDISRGSTPANSPDSGYGLSLLAENDATPDGRLAGETARAFAGSSSNLLELYADKVKVKRKTIVTGGRGINKTMEWAGKDLAGQTRVVVPPDSVLPRSHAGMLKMATDLLQNKPDWFPTPTSWLKIATVPGFEDIQGQMDDDVARADYENYLMAQGIELIPEQMDDDAKHLQWHHHHMKSSEWYSSDEKTKNIFRAHCDAHQQNAAHKAGVATGLQSAHPNLASTPMGQLPGGMQAAQAQPLAGPQPQLPDSGADAFVPSPDIPLGM